MATGLRNTRVASHLLKGILILEAASLAVVILVTFTVYRPRLQQQTLDEAVAAGEALAAQIDIALRSVVGYSDFYINSPELLHALDAYEGAPGPETEEAVCDVLTRIQPTGSANVRSALVLREKLLFTSESGLTEADLRVVRADWLQDLKAGTTAEEFAPFYSLIPDGENDSMMYLRGFTLHGRPYILGLVCDTGNIEQDIRRLSEGLFSGYALASKAGPAFFTAGELSNGADMLSRHTGAAACLDHDETGYYIVSTIPAGAWKLLGYLSNESFSGRFMSVLTAALLMCVLVCVLAVIMVVPFSQWLLRPVGALRDAMEQATQGDLEVRVTVRQGNEIGQLGEYFNHMLIEIQETRALERQAEQRAQEVRYSLLTSQINAHYIYHTMSSVNALARMGRCDEAVQVNSALIRILQNSLQFQSGSLFTTVRKGLDTLRAYWSIEVLRPGNHAIFRCEAAEEVLELPLLKNILQPLVENSLRHGLTDAETGEITGEVVVTAERRDGYLRILVCDNGTGIPPALLERLNAPGDVWHDESRHIGIANIRKRLFFAFHGRASLRLTSQNGTQAELLCPLDPS